MNIVDLYNLLRLL